jgi:hypothetical protein
VRAVSCALILVVAACGDNVQGNIAIDVPSQWVFAVNEEVALTPYRGLTLGGDAPLKISVVDDATIPAEGYQLTGGPMQFEVHAHDVLGAQYGVAGALENLGFRFRHPFDIYAPVAPRDEGEAGPVHVPQIRVRGLHLHTIHPIEGYFALWEPSASSTNDAHRIIDWVIKNRGNYLQWAGLDDIIKNPDKYAAWKGFTAELLDYAHKRGIRVGIDFELFGKSNLQEAFDLVDDPAGSLTDQVGARLPLLTALPFDVYLLSFGEFFDSDPQQLIDAINEVARQLRIAAPTAEMHALVHVGAPTQIVSYMGMDVLYYFLVKYADPSVIPDIHTVMYYDLFEDAGGAYQSPDFSQHRQYLLDRMCAHQKAAYHPEDAYWVAFDDSVPMFDPIYVHSRLLDLSMLAQSGCGPLDEHLIFSTGWEWGYWLNDYASLRASYELTDPATIIHDAYTPDLGDAAAIVDGLASEQHDALLVKHLAPYMAGRDGLIDGGRMLGIISQPDRITFDQLTPDMIGSFTDTVITPLAAHADAMDGLAKQLAKVSLPDSRWAREVSDGLTIDRLRARFVLATYGAVLAHLGGGDASRPLADAAAILGQAKTVVAARHHDLHDTHPGTILGKTTNDTSFQYGYLHLADTLCYWRRELTQVENILGTSSDLPSACFFSTD